ncbi:MAG: 2'-5' RNA ligase family protein [Bacillota bacterium]|nr:2'-5' RNA ligase family protein [Bacillota bacterium]
MADFFLGIRLPKELEETCENYRRAFKAPRTVSHLTVIAPFAWERAVEDLEEVIKTAVGSIPAFEIQGCGLGSFGTRVLFVNVDLSPELQKLHRALAQHLRQEGVSIDRRPYHPHITLATRLSPGQYARCQKELEGFSPHYSFLCEAVSLFEFTAERRWQERVKISLAG